MLSNLPIAWYFMVACLMASLSVFKLKDSPAYLKLFSPFLLVTVITEIVGLIISEQQHNNTLFYNCFILFEFCFFLFVLSCIVKRADVKKFLRITQVVYLVGTILNIFIFQRNSFHSITYCIGCLLIVICCIYYFFELFSISESINLLHEPSFWICSGLLFYYCCSFPLMGLLNFFSSVPQILVRNMFIIFNAMNILLYSLFTIAFLCRHKIQKSISLS